MPPAPAWDMAFSRICGLARVQARLIRPTTTPMKIEIALALAARSASASVVIGLEGFIAFSQLLMCLSSKMTRDPYMTRTPYTIYGSVRMSMQA